MPCIPYDEWSPVMKAWLSDYLDKRVEKPETARMMATTVVKPCPWCGGDKTWVTEPGVMYCKPCSEHYFVPEAPPAPDLEGRSP